MGNDINEKTILAVASYAQRHRNRPVELTELINEIAGDANTSTTIAKKAIFRAMDRGEASFYYPSSTTLYFI